MNNIELATRCVDWLSKKSRITKTRPYSYTAQQVATGVEGYAGNVGRISEQVVAELRARGIKIKYVNNVNPRRFELLDGST